MTSFSCLNYLKMKKTEGPVFRLYYGIHEKAGSMPSSSRRPAQTSDTLLIWETQDISYTQKLFLVCELNLPNPENVHTKQEGCWGWWHGLLPTYREWGWWVQSWEQLFCSGLYRAASLSNKQKTVAWLEAMMPDLCPSQKKDPYSSTFQVMPCTKPLYENCVTEITGKLCESNNEEGIPVLWPTYLPRLGVTLLLPMV